MSIYIYDYICILEYLPAFEFSQIYKHVGQQSKRSDALTPHLWPHLWMRKLLEAVSFPVPSHKAKSEPCAVSSVSAGLGTVFVHLKRFKS